MPTFLCQRCGAVENTATSHYWSNKMDNKPVLCSKCETGVWHGRFERKHWSAYGLSEVLKAQKENMGDFINAREHLRNIGIIGSKKNLIKEIDWES